MRWANIRFLSNYQESKNTRTGRLSRNYTWTMNFLAGAISWCRCTKTGSSPRCLKRKVFWWLPTKPAQWSYHHLLVDCLYAYMSVLNFQCEPSRLPSFPPLFIFSDQSHFLCPIYTHARSSTFHRGFGIYCHNGVGVDWIYYWFQDGSLS